MYFCSSHSHQIKWFVVVVFFLSSHYGNFSIFLHIRWIVDAVLKNLFFKILSNGVTNGTCILYFFWILLDDFFMFFLYIFIILSILFTNEYFHYDTQTHLASDFYSRFPIKFSCIERCRMRILLIFITLHTNCITTYNW